MQTKYDAANSEFYGDNTKAFCEETGLSISSVKTGRGNFLNYNDGNTYDIWKTTVKTDIGKITLKMYMGIGHNGKAPSIEDILSSFQADYIHDNVDFEEWFSDMYGNIDTSEYETVKRMKSVYKASEKQTAKINKLFNDDQLEKLFDLVI